MAGLAGRLIFDFGMFKMQLLSVLNSWDDTTENLIGKTPFLRVISFALNKGMKLYTRERY